MTDRFVQRFGSPPAESGVRVLAIQFVVCVAILLLVQPPFVMRYTDGAATLSTLSVLVVGTSSVALTVWLEQCTFAQSGYEIR